jgi:hypothetical protein
MESEHPAVPAPSTLQSSLTAHYKRMAASRTSSAASDYPYSNYTAGMRAEDYFYSTARNETVE